MTAGYLELLNAEEARLTAELSDIVIARKVYLAMLSKVLERQECLSGRDERSDDISNTETPVERAIPEGTERPSQAAPPAMEPATLPTQSLGAEPRLTGEPHTDDLSFPKHLKREIGEGCGASSLRSSGRTPADA